MSTPTTDGSEEGLSPVEPDLIVEIWPPGGRHWDAFKRAVADLKAGASTVVLLDVATSSLCIYYDDRMPRVRRGVRWLLPGFALNRLFA